MSRHEDGFTLVEILVVLVIIAILVTVALGFSVGARVRAADSAARSNIEVAVPAFQAYFLDSGTYAGMTLRRLQTRYSPGIQNIAVVSARATTYCVRSRVENRTWYKLGPSGAITTTRCT